ncbi:MAG TPA: alpha-2-macroglobulin family protein [Polyangiaceae bacterium]|nr:alpha-2-macroglobulin family protein [Polyangiaceae bacterium]
MTDHVPRAARLRGVVFALALLTSCFQGARAPKVETRGVLAPGREDAAAKPGGAFGVVLGSPQGEVGDPSEISVVFNRPMRPLEIAGSETVPPVVLTPAVKGAWRWVGTSAVLFAPEGHLPRATSYRVSVPAGTRALDGARLAEPYEFRFATPTPEVVSTEPFVGAKNLTPRTKVALRWNQAVTDAEVARAVKMTVENRSVGFGVRRPDAKNLQLLELVPNAPLATNSAVDVVVSAGFVGAEGPRPAGREQKLSYRTYGPLAVVRLSCNTDTPHGKCAPGSDVELQLTNAVKIKDLKRALVIEPPIATLWGSHADDETTSWLSLPARFAPAKAFTVRLRSSVTLPGGKKTELRDEYGQALAQDWTGRLEFDDLWPAAEIGVAGTYLDCDGCAGGSDDLIAEANRKRAIPVAFVNVNELELATLAPKPPDVFRLFEDAGPESTLFDRLVGSGGAGKKVRPRSPKNAMATIAVRADEVLGKGRRGPMAIGIRYTERAGTERADKKTSVRVVQVTDLGLTAKMSREGTLVWVTSLSTGAPLAGASVEIRRSPDDGDTTSGAWTTDADGFAVIPKDKFERRDQAAETATIFVRNGDDWAYRRVVDTLSPYRYGARFEGSPGDGRLGMVFTERGLYRPGDVVKVKGIVREVLARGMKTPAGEEVKLALRGPDGEPVGNRQSATLSTFGTFALDLKVPESGRLGSYSLEARFGPGEGDERSELRGSFEVAEYRPAEFKVGVEPFGAAFARSRGYVRGDKGAWNVTGDYLYGAPMERAAVRYAVVRSPSSFSVPLPEGFVSGDAVFTADSPEASQRSSQIASGQAALDAKGRLAVDAPLSMPGQHEPENVTCEAEVTDVARQALSASSTTLVHPGEFYVGIKSGIGFFAKPGAAATPQVLVVDPEGKRKSRIAVHIELVTRAWSLVRQAASGGSLHSVATAVDTVVASCDLVSQETPQSCSLMPKAGGYYILRATAKDARGNKVGAASSFYVIGDGEGGWGDDDAGRVELVPDRKTYAVGQTARVLVKSPFKSAEALVTVERAGIFTKKRMKLSGPTPTVDVPITEEMRPNVYVSVHILRGRTKAAPSGGAEPDVGAPTFRAGYAALSIDPEARRLQVAVKTAKSRFLPRERVDVEVEVRDPHAAGAKSEVTLYAVDEGVLSLVGYKTPDPIPVFSAPRPLSVSTIESRQAMAAVSAPHNTMQLASLVKGLEGGGGGDSTRRDFRQSVYFNPALVTDASGHARASFTLPDSLTTYRIMAVAVGDDDRFGAADTAVVADRPLMARPQFPRVLRAGDDIDAGIVVATKGLPKTTVFVDVSAEGLTLTSAAKSQVVIEPNAPAEVRFAFKAERAGKAKVTFRVKGGGSSDSVEVTRAVLVPTSPEAVALYGDTTSRAGEKLGDLSSIRDDVGGLDLSVSSTALVGLGGGVEQLVEYPYGCTEQLTSRLVPLLPLRDLARDFKLKLPPDLDQIVAKTVVKILGNQRPDGGFGLFADSHHSLPWVSAYALWGLGEAKRRQIVVPSAAIEGATRYVRHELVDWARDPLRAATAAFVIDVLAENGSPDPGAMTRLFEDRKKLPLFAQASLLHAMAISKADAKSVGELSRDVEAHLRLDGPVARIADNAGDAYAPLMDSEARTTALVLRGLLAAAPEHALAARLAMGLLADRKHGTWRSTQETAWALLALDAYRRTQERTPPSFDVRAFFGDAEVLKAAFRGRQATSVTASIPAARLAGSGGTTLAFDLDGSGKLFYEARLRYSPRELPVAPLDRGFAVQKTLRPVKPEEIALPLGTTPGPSAEAVAGGDLVLCDLFVVTPNPREFVVIDDPLPAGLEPVDARLKTTSAALAVDAGGERQPAGGDDDTSPFEGSDPVRRELRDDRVLFFAEHLAAGMYHYRYLARATTLGTYVVPPTRAEEMYSPEIFGRTAASRFLVRAR